jgi:hypothetical protein
VQLRYYTAKALPISGLAGCRPLLRYRTTPNMETRRPSLFLRKFVVEFTGQLVCVRCFAKRLNLALGGIHIHAQVQADFLQHLKDSCEFLFRKHADLKIQVRPAFGLANHSTLTDQHEDRQEHAFGRDDERQDAKRNGSNALSPGITRRFNRHHPEIRIK